MSGKWKKSMGKLSALQELQLGSEVSPKTLRERSKNLEKTFGTEMHNRMIRGEEQGGRRWPGRSSKRRRRKSRRKSKRRKSRKKKRRRKRKRTKKRRRKRRR
tara:strand:- start:744 stop:1049 length:306 start_codon:yes stop_codon:yes gene_type:complete